MKLYEGMYNKMVIIRSDKSGVWFGRLQHVEGHDARIQDARRVYYWEGAGSCSGLAASGPSSGKICEPLKAVVVVDFCECLEADDIAIDRFAKVSPWVIG